MSGAFVHVEGVCPCCGRPITVSYASVGNRPIVEIKHRGLPSPPPMDFRAASST